MERMAQARELARVFNYIEELVSQNQPLVVLIDGPAGAGKTTLAKEIATAFSSVNVVHMDDLYNGWDNPLNQELYARIERQILRPHIAGDEITHEVFNWHAGTFATNVNLQPKQILIVEGVGSASIPLRGFADLIIYVEISAEAGFERVINRDGQGIFEKLREWQVMEREYFNSEQTKSAANLQINGTL